VVALLIFFDGFQTIASGVVQALGFQHRGAIINGIAFYLCGVPLGIFLGFYHGLGAVGLYLGILSGAIIQAIAYGALIYLTNWDEQAE
jgi:MATE family multidrug resistance protein